SIREIRLLVYLRLSRSVCGRSELPLSFGRIKGRSSSPGGPPCGRGLQRSLLLGRRAVRAAGPGPHLLDLLADRVEVLPVAQRAAGHQPGVDAVAALDGPDLLDQKLEDAEAEAVAMRGLGDLVAGGVGRLQLVEVVLVGGPEGVEDLQGPLV